MAYITLADLETRYGADELIMLADRNQDSTPDPDVIAAAIGDAEGMINSYLAGRYAIPLAAPVPAEIVRIACAIARYHLFDDNPTDKVRTDYKDAIKLLEDISAGRASIVITSPTTAGSDLPDFNPGDPQFTTLTGY